MALSNYSFHLCSSIYCQTSIYLEMTNKTSILPKKVTHFPRTDTHIFSREILGKMIKNNIIIQIQRVSDLFGIKLVNWYDSLITWSGPRYLYSSSMKLWQNRMICQYTITLLRNKEELLWLSNSTWMNSTSLSLFPFGSKSLPPPPPPSL